jgi:predicted nuclease of restriction endonuclease-like (RecB) superfamily
MNMNLVELAEALKEINTQTSSYASKAINLAVTVRNWIYGYYIQEYELNGNDRAKYGEKVISTLSEMLSAQNVQSCSRRQLHICRKFYIAYPSIMQTSFAQFERIFSKNLLQKIVQTPSAQFEEASKLAVSSTNLLNSLSFSHFVELLKTEGSLKRVFYEMECVKGNWSVIELRRQINSLYYERSALSKNKDKLSEIAHSDAQPYKPLDVIRDPYVFEFLGIKSHEVVLESKLADELRNKLQNFLMELGRGFCFEARNKRILIGDEYFFVDLVFYHRILKCHVLIELKTDKFNHSYMGQLNTYVKYFKKFEMQPGDNPPIGILLCTEKNNALVEFAMDESVSNIFVSKYKLELPTENEMKKFIEEQLKK